MIDFPDETRSPADRARAFVEAFFRHKKKAIVLPAMILALATLVILFAPRKYRSEAKLFIQIGRESVNLDPTATTGDTISLQSSDRGEEIKTVIDMLQSRGIVEKVVAQLGPDVVLGRSSPGAVDGNLLTDALETMMDGVVTLVRSIDPFSDAERAAIRIEKNLEAEAERDSTLIAVRFDGKTPQLAQLVTQTLVGVFQQEHLRLHHTSGSKEFFKQQHDSLRQQLDDAVDQLRLAKNRLHIVSIESRRETLESRLSNIELTRYQTLQQLAATEARIAELKRQIAAVPERITAEQTTVPDTGTDSLRAQIYELQVLMLDQQSKYHDDHPFLQATRDQLREAEAMLKTESPDRQETTDNVNPKHMTLTLTMAQVKSELAGILAQRDQLDEQRGTVLADLTQLNDSELEIDQLTRDVQLARTNYFRYAENLEKARIDDELNRQRISNAIVAQAATLSEKPVSPSKAIIGVLALAAAISSAISIVLIGDAMSDRVATCQQLEQALQVPVLSVIPNDKSYAKVMV